MKVLGSINELITAVFRGTARTVTIDPDSGNTGLNTNLTLTLADTGGEATTEIITKHGSQTLLTKTLTAPLITTNGSIDVTGAGTLTIGASAGANNITLGGATSTVVVAGNLSVTGNVDVAKVQDDTFSIVDAGDDTRAINFDAGTSATTGTVTTIKSSQTTNKTLTLPDITDTVITRTSTDTGTSRIQNKELSDDNVLIVDPADTTKKLRIDAGSISTGTTRVITAADGDSIIGGDSNNTDILTRTGSQTGITNKTLVSPVLTTPVITTNGSIDVSGAGTLTIGASVGANNLTIGHADSTVVIAGNLSVSGTTTTINSTTLDVTDPNITVNNGGNQSTANSSEAGLTVEMSDATNHKLAYSSSSTTGWRIGSGTLDSTDDVVDTGTAQTLTNKTLNAAAVGGAANDGTDGYLLLRDQSADPSNSGLTGADADSVKLFAKDKGVWYVDSSGIAQQVGSGSGSGEINYIDNPSAAAAITGWTPVGNLDVARTTEAIDAGSLPRENTAGSGIKITADSNTQSTSDYVYFHFDLDDIDKSRLLKIEWSQKVFGTYTDGQLEVYIAAQGSEGTALITPVNTSIPSADQTFSSSFLSTTATALALVIRATGDMTTDGGIVISDVVVGPGKTASGAVVGSTTVSTISFGATPPTKGSAQTDKFSYYRVGEWLHATFEYHQAAGGSNSSGTVTINLPSGLTVDTTKLTGVGSGVSRVGTFYSYTTTNTEWIGTLVTSGGASSVTLAYNSDADSVSFMTYTQLNFSNAVTVSGHFTVPITQWASSGTMNVLQEDNLSEWTAMSASQINWSLDADSKLYYRRIGSDMEVSIYGLISSASGDLTFTLPNGLTINDTIVDVTGSFVDAMDGRGLLLDSPTTYYDIFPFRSSSTAIRFRDIGSNNTVSSTVPFSVTGSDEFKLTLKIPITQWANVNQNSLVGFSQFDGTNAGLMVDPESLSDAAATMLGHKIYYHGTSYNGGVAPTVTLSTDGGSGSTVTKSFFIPRKLSDGTWMCKFTINMAMTNTARTYAGLNVNGLTPDNTGNQTWACTLAGLSAGPSRVYVNGTQLYASFSSTATTYIEASGEILLSSKPTWAY